MDLFSDPQPRSPWRRRRNGLYLPDPVGDYATPSARFLGMMGTARSCCPSCERSGCGYGSTGDTCCCAGTPPAQMDITIYGSFVNPDSSDYYGCTNCGDPSLGQGTTYTASNNVGYDLLCLGSPGATVPYDPDNLSLGYYELIGTPCMGVVEFGGDTCSSGCTTRGFAGGPFTWIYHEPSFCSFVLAGITVQYDLFVAFRLRCSIPYGMSTGPNCEALAIVVLTTANSPSAQGCILLGWTTLTSPTPPLSLVEDCNTQTWTFSGTDGLLGVACGPTTPAGPCLPANGDDFGTVTVTKH